MNKLHQHQHAYKYSLLTSDCFTTHKCQLYQNHELAFDFTGRFKDTFSTRNFETWTGFKKAYLAKLSGEGNLFLYLRQEKDTYTANEFGLEFDDMVFYVAFVTDKKYLFIETLASNGKTYDIDPIGDGTTDIDPKDSALQKLKKPEGGIFAWKEDKNSRIFKSVHILINTKPSMILNYDDLKDYDEPLYVFFFDQKEHSGRIFKVSVHPYVERTIKLESLTFTDEDAKFSPISSPLSLVIDGQFTLPEETDGAPSSDFLLSVRPDSWDIYMVNTHKEVYHHGKYR